MSEPKCILVVDDDEAIRDLMRLVLADEGYKVVEAENGAKALSVLKGATPDLILLDMRMPVMDGWAFAAAYAGEPGPKAPIVVFTAARDAEARSTEISADAYLGKPFVLDDLIAKIDRLVR
jgi:CheY-like chemotaxis protein